MHKNRDLLHKCHSFGDLDLAMYHMHTELDRRSFDPNGPAWATYVRAENARAEWIEAMYTLADYLDDDDQ